MIDNFEMTLVRIEGLGSINDKLKCHLSVNEELVETVNLKDLEVRQQIFAVPSKALVKLTVEEKNIIASLQFSMRIIKCQGYHWLPLFKNAQDMIFEVPEEVALPRILLIFQSSNMLSPVIEITETSEMSEHLESNDEELGNKLEMKMKILELEHSLHLEKVTNGQAAEEMKREFKNKLEKVQLELEKYQIWTEKYREKSELLAEELEKSSKKIVKIQEENDEIKIEIGVYKSKYEELTAHIEKINNLLVAREKELKSLGKGRTSLLEIAKTDSVSAFPKKTRLKLVKDLANPKQQSADLIDSQLKSSLLSLNLEGLFQRTTEQYYKVGCKKVGIVLKNGSIFCKFGDTLKTLENYIFSHCNSELESFIQKRANNKPKHRRIHSFSNSFDQTYLKPPNGSAGKSLSRESTPSASIKIQTKLN